MWGLWGRPRLRPGRRRSGQPRQHGHRLRRQAVPLGSAYALAARRSRPSGLALSLVTRSAPSRPSGARAPKGRRSGALTSARPLPPRAAAAGGNLDRRAHWRRQAPPSPRFARGGARGTPPAGGNACGRVMPAGLPAGKAKASAALAAPPPLRRPCLPVSRPARANRGGCPALCGPPAPSHFGENGGAFYVCCCLSCVWLWLWSCLVVGLPVWRCLWLVACSVCSVSLAVRSGGGVCLSAGGGFCPRLLLACWCSRWSAGCCPLRVAPRSGCSVAADQCRFGPDRRQLPPQKEKIPLR